MRSVTCEIHMLCWITLEVEQATVVAAIDGRLVVRGVGEVRASKKSVALVATDKLVPATFADESIARACAP